MDLQTEVLSMNINDFINFLSEKNITGIIVASLLSSRINEMVDEFLNTILIPMFNIDTSKKSDSDKSINVFNYSIKYGTLIIAITKFILVMIIAYYALKLFRKLI